MSDLRAHSEQKLKEALSPLYLFVDYQLHILFTI